MDDRDACGVAGDCRVIVVRVPAGLAYQLVYRLERREPYAVDPVPGVDFHFCRGLPAYLRHRGPLRRLVGAKEWAKGAARIARGRMFYCLRKGDSLMHTGWATVSSCRYYRVRPGDVVIGPIWSSDAARGRGLATYATHRAINEMIALGRSVFYIDTSDTNISCQRVIQKCGFADPIATYLR
jgi:Acetyltransferase (GNAT) domain